MLPRLRELSSKPEGARQKVVERQNECFQTTNKDILLYDLKLEVSPEKFGDPPTTVPGGVLQLILMACAGSLFVNIKWHQIESEEQFDIISNFAECREVCRAFYLAMVDCWPLLQEEFVKSMVKFIKSNSELEVKQVMQIVDPSLSEKYHSSTRSKDEPAANALCFTFHQRLKRHLRYHCAPYLLMLLSNDIKISQGNITGTKNIPTLSGFAVYLDTAFGGIIKESIKTGDLNKTICLLYESERAPAWNMLPDENITKNLQDYLDGVAHNASMAIRWKKLVCAPADLFPNPKEWPNLSEIGSLHTYIFKGGNPEGGNPEGGDVMPPIRMVKVSAWKEHKGHIEEHLVAEITLPMRLLFHQTQTRETFQTSTTWIPAFDYYTMNVTTSMLTQSTWLGEMPPGFEIEDHQGGIINENNAIVPNSPLPASMFETWADVMLTVSSSTEFRECVNNLPLFRNFFMVQESIRNILPKVHCRDCYIDCSYYESSPIQQDWGETFWFNRVFLDKDFTDQFENNTAFLRSSWRSSWATSTFFDMSRDFLKANGDKEDNTIWKERLLAEDIAPLMSTMDGSWPRHQFPTAECVSTVQHINLTAQASSLTQTSVSPLRKRPKIRMVTNFHVIARSTGRL